MTATYQTRRNADAAWNDRTAREIRDEMERAGLRFSEITGLVQDMDKGHLLTADNGRQFRAAECPHLSTETQAAEYDTNTRYGIMCCDCGEDVTAEITQRRSDEF